MHRLWYSYPDLVLRILAATRNSDVSISNFLDPSELSAINEESRDQLARSFKVDRLMRMTVAASDLSFRRTMRTCALVCRVFCEPALRLLWQQVPLFHHIVQLFSCDVKVKRFAEAIPVSKVVHSSICRSSSMYRSFK